LKKAQVYVYPMRITSLSIILAVPFLLILGILLPLAFSYEHEWLFPWLIIPVIILTALYIFRPQIDYWWIQRQKLGLDAPLVQWLNENSIFYKSLDENGRQKFETRAALFLESKDFLLKAFEDHKLPEQYKLLAIHEALRITWNHEDFLFENYDRIILYPHAFPTPDHKYLHPYEVHHSDGIVLMSKPHVENGYFNPAQYFNVSLYTWIVAHMKETKHTGYPMINANDIEKLNPILPYPTAKIKELLGERLVFSQALYAYVYLMYPEKFKNEFNNIHSQYQDLFGELSFS